MRTARKEVCRKHFMEGKAGGGWDCESMVKGTRSKSCFWPTCVHPGLLRFVLVLLNYTDADPSRHYPVMLVTVAALPGIRGKFSIFPMVA